LGDAVLRRVEADRREVVGRDDERGGVRVAEGGVGRRGQGQRGLLGQLVGGGGVGGDAGRLAVFPGGEDQRAADGVVVAAGRGGAVARVVGDGDRLVRLAAQVDGDDADAHALVVGPVGRSREVGGRLRVVIGDRDRGRVRRAQGGVR